MSFQQLWVPAQDLHGIKLVSARMGGGRTTHRWEKEGDTTYATTGIGLDGVC